MSSHWLAILLSGIERKDLDYKAANAWDESDKKACCEIVKDILGMANTDGGYVVIGVAEEQGVFKWTGLTADQLATWDTSRLNRFLQNYAEPPINARLVKIENEGATFVLIEVPVFSDTPHLCQKGYPGVLTAPALYVRTDNNETAPVSSSADFRAVVERSVRNRSDRLLESFRAILTGSADAASEGDRDLFEQQIAEAFESAASRDPYPDKGYTGYYQCVAAPSRFVRDRFPLPYLRGAADKASVNYRGWPFLFVDEQHTYVVQDGIETTVQTDDFNGNDMYDFWQLRCSGLLVHQALMREECMARHQEVGAFAAVTEVVSYVAEAVDSMGRLYTALDLAGEDISLELRLRGTNERVLRSIDPGKAPLRGVYASRVPSIAVGKVATLEEWRAARVDMAAELAREVFLHFNWPSPPIAVFRGDIERLFARYL